MRAFSLRTMLTGGAAPAALTIAALAIAAPAFAQTLPGQETPPAETPTGAATPVQDSGTRGGGTQDADAGREILVTGSRIKQDPNNSALPLQIITNAELERNGISSPEQLVSFLTTNGTGADNLASNADVVSGAQRGTNGLSSANLRGQGSAATLVLLNGRRVAAHGLSGSAVDVNQIPFAAIERVEILKDGASAIYGTDAVGGVINFITRKDYKGLGLQAFTDTTDQGGGNIYRLSGVAGWGDLDKNGFNVMGAVSYSWNNALRANQRDFTNSNQPNRGLSIDTRGTPIATIFNTAANLNQAATARGTLLGTATGFPALNLVGPNGAAQTAINPLALPGGAGCGSMPQGLPYDYQLWAQPGSYYACSYDTSQSVVLQQPIQTLTYYARGVARIAGAHDLSIEVTGSDADSSKRFSEAQLSAGASLPLAYPLNDATRTTYNSVFNSLVSAFPTQAAALNARYGLPISYRYRCLSCGVREYNTNTKTFRVAAGIEGPIAGSWDYRAGASYARSESSSTLGTGYYYRGTLANGANDPAAPSATGTTSPGILGVLNAGLINPFSITQSAAGLAALNQVSAYGATLFGGKYEVKQFDYSISGPLFGFLGRKVQLAAGVDYRRESYSFNGSPAAAASAANILLAAFDNVNALTPKSRTVKAAYAEVLVPFGPNLEVTGAFRADDYTGFGTTTNPKVSVKFRPFEPLMFRGSYNTGFRVPTFNQIFNGITESPSTGSNLVDPRSCPSLAVSATAAGCANITPTILTGGNLVLGPETAKQFSVGGVLTPFPRFSASVDWWVINVDNTITALSVTQLQQFYSLFPDRYLRDAAGNVTAINATFANAGARRTQGLEVALRGGADALGGSFTAGLDGTYLLKKREKLTAAAPYGPSLIGVYSLNGDLGLKWKHNAFVGYSNGDFTFTLTQLYRDGYRNFGEPSFTNNISSTRPDYNEFVDNYITYNAALAFTGIQGMKWTLGVRNLFDRDPPFAITYDSNGGSGGAWEPRVADPRGRSYTMNVEVKF